MTATPGQTYISGFVIPQYFGDEAQKLFVRKWTITHAQDHTNIYGTLNSLEKALSLPLFRLNQYTLFFDPENLNMVNDFAFMNNFQHQEFYKWINDLGAKLVDFGKEPMVVYPLLNPMSRFLKLSMENFNQFFFLENKVHTMILSGINNLYRAYGA